MKDYDVLIVGAGQAGIPLARKLADRGKRVAIVERKHLGGSCVNFGCTPTKAVLASARVAQVARRAAEFGIVLPQPKIDFGKVIDRARAFVEESKSSLKKGLDECGADIIRGQGHLAGRDGKIFLVSVDDKSLRASQVVINTGTRTLVPDMKGLDRVSYLHAGNWLECRHLPEQIIFVGGGSIALEMAQFYRRMGSQVTVVSPDLQVAEHEDADIARALQKLLEQEGIVFRLGARVVSVTENQGGVSASIESAGKFEVIGASHLFIATGRRPNTDDVGLESVGVKVDRHGFIEVDDRLATSEPGIWAAGDVRGGPMFTHTSWDDHRILESQLLGDGSRNKTGRIVPYAIFTDPELGRVGLTEKEARDQCGEDVKVVTFEMRHNGRATEVGEPAGVIKLIADARDGRLLGAAVLTLEGAEIVSHYITLMNAHATLDAICDGIYIHPTLSEAMQSAAMALRASMESK